jgi:hypothetical protein
MEVSLQAVRRVFEDVLNGCMSREQADRWASMVVREEEAGIVVFSPPREREHIWAGVMYLYGIDAMKAPGAYLHSNDDIREAMMARLAEAGPKDAVHPTATRLSISRTNRMGEGDMTAAPSRLRADQLDVLLRGPSGDVAPP